MVEMGLAAADLEDDAAVADDGSRPRSNTIKSSVDRMLRRRNSMEYRASEAEIENQSRFEAGISQSIKMSE